MSDTGDIGIGQSLTSNAPAATSTPAVAIAVTPTPGIPTNSKTAPKVITDNVKSQLPTIIIGALTVTAGLAWNDAISSLINVYVPPEYRKSNNAWFKILYAFVLTIVLVIIMSLILYYMT
jgi:hypothetical protein